MPPARLPEHFHWLTVQRYNKKQLFAIVCSDFVLKSAHIFNIYTENQAVTKPLNISHLKKGKCVIFVKVIFVIFKKTKTLFTSIKNIYKYIYLYIFFIELFFIFKIKNDKNDFDKNDKVS